MHRCIAICRTAIHVSIHVVPYRYVERFYSGFCVRYIRLSRLQNDIFQSAFHWISEDYKYICIQGSSYWALWRKILPKVGRFRLREVDLPYFFTCLIVYSSRITPVFAHGDTADCQVTLNRLPLLINPYAIIG